MTTPDTPSAKPSLEAADVLNTRIKQIAHAANLGAESAFCQPHEILPLLVELRERRAQVTELRAALGDIYGAFVPDPPRPDRPAYTLESGLRILAKAVPLWWRKCNPGKEPTGTSSEDTLSNLADAFERNRHLLEAHDA